MGFLPQIYSPLKSSKSFGCKDLFLPLSCAKTFLAPACIPGPPSRLGGAGWAGLLSSHQRTLSCRLEKGVPSSRQMRSHTRVDFRSHLFFWSGSPKNRLGICMQESYWGMLSGTTTPVWEWGKQDCAEEVEQLHGKLWSWESSFQNVLDWDNGWGLLFQIVNHMTMGSVAWQVTAQWPQPMRS